ncbi:TPA: hypothetical protein H1011_02005 [archaeon]|jgi:chromosome segregation ATPase|uniref:Uncharacterized protein n=1 Tax=Candidatus Undinarchaeum marinum TaxID=2756141 RepID=A0A832V208_9ARCH|nr:hypothetical protein [Candidatus Undinarchaeum marinum]
MSKEEVKLRERIKELRKKSKVGKRSTIQEYIEALTELIPILEKLREIPQRDLEFAEKKLDDLQKRIKTIDDEITLARGEQTKYYTLKLERGEKTRLGEIEKK